jgi:hypothetical protein
VSSSSEAVEEEVARLKSLSMFSYSVQSMSNLPVVALLSKAS